LNRPINRVTCNFPETIFRFFKPGSVWYRFHPVRSGCKPNCKKGLIPYFYIGLMIIDSAKLLLSSVSKLLDAVLVSWASRKCKLRNQFYWKRPWTTRDLGSGSEEGPINSVNSVFVF
jgi:hypothetical protein